MNGAVKAADPIRENSFKCFLIFPREGLSAGFSSFLLPPIFLPFIVFTFAPSIQKPSFPLIHYNQWSQGEFFIVHLSFSGLRLEAKHTPEIRKTILRALPQSTWSLQQHRRHFHKFPASWEEPRRGPDHLSVPSNLHDLLCHTLSNQQLCTHGWCTGEISLERCKH